MLINWWNPLTAIDIEIRGMLLVHFNDTSPVICVGWRIDRCENKMCTCNLWHTKVRIVCVCPTLHLYAQNFFTHVHNISRAAKVYCTFLHNFLCYTTWIWILQFTYSDTCMQFCALKRWYTTAGGDIICEHHSTSCIKVLMTLIWSHPLLPMLHFVTEP